MRMSSRLQLPIAVLFAAAITGCAVPSLRRANRDDAATAAAANASSWATTLLAAQREVERGRHADADRLLREFGERAAPAPESVATMYWRAVFMLDPASSTGSTREAVALLARYLDADVPLTHRTEAVVLQRIAAALAAPREGAAPGRGAATDAELKALKEELELTKAELERIKKRIAPPPTTPPTAPPPSLP